MLLSFVKTNGNSNLKLCSMDEKKNYKTPDMDERALVSEEAWNSRPGVYTDEELDEILRKAEESGEWISHEEAMAEFEKLVYKDF